MSRSYQLGQFLRQPHVAPGRLQTLHDVAAAHEQNPAPSFDQCMAESADEMALADPRGSEQENVGTVSEPLVALGQCHDMRLRDARHGGEVEARQALVRAQLRLGPVAVDAPRLALGDLVFEHGFQQTLTGPALSVGLGADVARHPLDRRQP